MKTYSELIQLPSFEERFEYLKLGGSVGVETFGFDRYLNQRFYRSQEWKNVRHQIILRDNGCDLGILDRPIYNRILIHHINPIKIDDIQHSPHLLLNPEYLISTSKRTHDAIHYGDASSIDIEPIIRKENDTIPWR